MLVAQDGHRVGQVGLPVGVGIAAVEERHAAVGAEDDVSLAGGVPAAGISRRDQPTVSDEEVLDAVAGRGDLSENNELQRRVWLFLDDAETMAFAVGPCPALDSIATQEVIIGSRRWAVRQRSGRILDERKGTR